MAEVARKVSALKKAAIALRSAGDKLGAVQKVREMKALQAQLSTSLSASSLDTASKVPAPRSIEELKAEAIALRAAGDKVGALQKVREMKALQAQENPSLANPSPELTETAAALVTTNEHKSGADSVTTISDACASAARDSPGAAASAIFDETTEGMTMPGTDAPEKKAEADRTAEEEIRDAHEVAEDQVFSESKRKPLTFTAERNMAES